MTLKTTPVVKFYSSSSYLFIQHFLNACSMSVIVLRAGDSSEKSDKPLPHGVNPYSLKTQRLLLFSNIPLTHSFIFKSELIPTTPSCQ